jgi:hypothetical protein
MKEKTSKAIKGLFNIFVALLLISGIVLPVIIALFTN